MSNFIQRWEFEANGKLMAAQDGRKWEELPDSVQQAYVEKAIQRAEKRFEDFKTERKSK